MEVTVLGAGVSGLTTGIRLLESGFNVKIVTEKKIDIIFYIMVNILTNRAHKVDLLE